MRPQVVVMRLTVCLQGPCAAIVVCARGQTGPDNHEESYTLEQVALEWARGYIKALADLPHRETAICTKKLKVHGKGRQHCAK